MPESHESANNDSQSQSNTNLPEANSPQPEQPAEPDAKQDSATPAQASEAAMDNPNADQIENPIGIAASEQISDKPEQKQAPHDSQGGEIQSQKIEPATLHSEGNSDSESEWDDTPIQDLFPTQKVEAEAQTNHGTLYIVSTPIGHIDDITLRALEILKKADVVVCEEIKPAARLLHEHRISKELMQLNEHNEQEAASDVINELKKGSNVALISDAGTPLLADPGEVLVRLAVKNDIPVKSVPGASSILAGLVCSGLPIKQFVFAGFLNREPAERVKELTALAAEQRTVVILETPYRLKPLLEAAATVMPTRRAFLGCKLTSSYETMHYGSLLEIKTKFDSLKFKGEFVLIFAGAAQDEKMFPINESVFKGDEDRRPIKPGKRAGAGGRTFKSRGERSSFHRGPQQWRDDKRPDDRNYDRRDDRKHKRRDDRDDGHSWRKRDDNRDGGGEERAWGRRDNTGRRDDDRRSFGGGHDRPRRGDFNNDGFERPRRQNFNIEEDEGPKQVRFKRSASTQNSADATPDKSSDANVNKPNASNSENTPNHGPGGGFSDSGESRKTDGSVGGSDSPAE